MIKSIPEQKAEVATLFTSNWIYSLSESGKESIGIDTIKENIGVAH
jgi:hypothetical protein